MQEYGLGLFKANVRWAHTLGWAMKENCVRQ
jgi:hypothetical protein